MAKCVPCLLNQARGRFWTEVDMRSHVETGIFGFERLVRSDESMRRLSAAGSLWERSSAGPNHKTASSESEGGPISAILATNRYIGVKSASKATPQGQSMSSSPDG